jgi:hypothetical protein
MVACVFVAAGMCLPSRCLAMDVSSHFTVPTFGCQSQYFPQAYGRRGPDISVSTATSYGMDGRGSIPGNSKIFFSSLQHPDQLSDLFNPTQLVPGAISLGVKLTFRLHLVQSSRMVEQYLHSPCLHGIILN